MSLLVPCLRASNPVAHSRLTIKTHVAALLLGAAALLALPASQANAQAVSGSVAVPMSIVSLAGGGGTVPTATAESTSSANLQPMGAAVDSAGNVYIADFYNNLVEEVVAGTGNIVVIAGGASNTTVPSTTAAAATSVVLNQPSKVALDSVGNLYLADYGHGLVEEITGLNGPNPPQIVVVAGGGSTTASNKSEAATSAALNQVVGVAVDGSNNLYIADTGNSQVEEVTGIGGANPPQIFVVAGGAGNGSNAVPSSSPQAATSANLSPFNMAFDASGNLYIADANNNLVEEVTGLSGGSPQVIAFAGGGGTVPGFTSEAPTNANITPRDLAVDSKGNLFIADNGNSLVEEVTGINSSNPQIISIAGGGSAASTTTPEPAWSAKYTRLFGVAADTKGNVYSVDLTGLVGKITPPVPFATTAVGASSATQNVYVGLTAASTVSGISVPKSQNGTAEFTLGTATGCVLDGTTVNVAGTVCTVPVTFNPQYPGTRTGALTVYSTGTTILGTAGLTGVGTGPLAVFSPGTSSVLNTGTPGGMALSGPFGEAVDGAGNLYIADNDYGDIVEVTPSGTSSLLNVGSPNGSALSGPTAVAVDGAGNVFIADQNNDRIVEFSAAGIASVLSTGSLTLNWAKGVAADQAGDVYIADTGKNRIVEVTPSGAASVLNLGTLTLNYPFGVAVDGSRNVYIADGNNNRVVEVTAAGAASVLNVGTPGGTALSTVFAVTVDAAGDVYIADQGNTRIVELTPAGVSSVVNVGNSLGSPQGIAIDAAGNLFVADSTKSQVDEVRLGTAPTLTFASTTVGSVSTDSPQAITVANIGNAPLTFSALAATTNFNLNGAGATCTSSSSLTIGETCNLSIDFAPTASGSLTGTVNITDNSLNVAANVQQISLSGTGIAASTTTTVVASSSAITVGQSETLTATVASTGTPTGTVTFYNGSTSLGTGTLTSGVATLSTTTLPVGADAITASYAGDANNTASVSTATTVTVSAAIPPATPSFTITAAPPSLTVTAGKSGTIIFTLTPTGGYTGTVALTCGTLPDHSSCAFAPATANLSTGVATITLTFSTDVTTAALQWLPRVHSNNPLQGLPVIPAMLFWLPETVLDRKKAGKSEKKRMPKFLMMGVMLALTLGALAISGCGRGPGPSNLSSGASSNVTPAGTQKVTITATGASNVTQTLAVNITVQ